MARIKVAVSPFYGGEAWTDELTGVTFEKHPRGLNVYSIPDTLDLTNIRKAIRLNNLSLVEGNIGELNEVKEVVVEAQEEAKVEEPKEEVKVEEKEEIEAEVEEEKEEAPKKAAAKKNTRKKK